MIGTGGYNISSMSQKERYVHLWTVQIKNQAVSNNDKSLILCNKSQTAKKLREAERKEEVDQS